MVQQLMVSNNTIQVYVHGNTGFEVVASNDRRVVALLFSQPVFHVDAVLPVMTRDAGRPSKTDTNNAMSLGTAQFCYIASRIRWMSAPSGVNAFISLYYSTSRK